MVKGDLVRLTGVTKFTPGWLHECARVVAVHSQRVTIEKLSGVPSKINKEGTMSTSRSFAKSVVTKLDPRVAAEMEASMLASGGSVPVASQVAPTPEETEELAAVRKQAEKAAADIAFGLDPAAGDGAFA